MVPNVLGNFCHHLIMKNLFNKDYYENGVSSGISLYTNYTWMPELTIPMAFRIIEILGIKENHTILDYGCAKGYLVRAMRLLYRNCYGVDISEYAVGEADSKISKYLSIMEDASGLKKLPFGISKFDFIIAKDVFEHISPEELKKVIANIRDISNCLFVIVPLGDGEKYYETAYEFDRTHIIREDVSWWTDQFIDAGFSVDKLDYRVTGIKDNWKEKRGNGIFILK